MVLVVEELRLQWGKKMTNRLAIFWNAFLDAKGGNKIVGDKDTFLKAVSRIRRDWLEKRQDKGLNKESSEWRTRELLTGIQNTVLSGQTETCSLMNTYMYMYLYTDMHVCTVRESKLTPSLASDLRMLWCPWCLSLQLCHGCVIFRCCFLSREGGQFCLWMRKPLCLGSQKSKFLFNLCPRKNWLVLFRHWRGVFSSSTVGLLWGRGSYKAASHYLCLGSPKHPIHGGLIAHS